MSEVNITELRQNLPDYLAEVRKGKELKVTVRGKVVARIVPEKGVQNAARQRLAALRTKCKVGGVVRPTEAASENGESASSDISLWEIAMLVAKKRLDPGAELTQFLHDMIQARALRVLPITPEIAAPSPPRQFSR